ncbi:D-2-hydroxyacid dehydrogenase [Gaoshiqia sp. Z1-71]|uniref:D-2-hydroxyacid dehydrogenase n=1 Tax=Gaoshiqia hydrogeniformans TaxID=3290090 RepID=UPI003BF85618
MKIVVLDGYTLNPGDLSWDVLASLGELTVYDRTLPEERLARLKGVHAAFTNKVIMDRELISALPDLKYLGVLATGYNVVDLDAASQAGIYVTNIPAYSTDSVAQLVFAHILHITNQVGLHADRVRNGAWANSIDFSFWLTPQTELTGKTLGIIGFGQIGQRVALLGKAFGMNILFQNRSVKTNIPADYQQVELTDLLSQSDIISINCPLTDDNRGFINRENLGRMKSSAILINTGRGPLINEQELADALNNGTIAAAGLDVLSVEPAQANNPLLKAKNCFITPHIAWASYEARQRLMHVAISNFEAYLENKPQNVVNNPIG